MDAFLNFFGLERKRRDSKRVLIDWLIDIQVPEKHSYRAFSGRDISTRGVSLEAPSTQWRELGMARDKHIQMRIRIPSKDLVVEADAKLKWELLRKDIATTGWEFILLKNEGQQFIEEYIKEQMSRLS